MAGSSAEKDTAATVEGAEADVEADARAAKVGPSSPTTLVNHR